MTLEPLTARIRFAFPNAKRIQEWAEITARFLETLAILCDRTGACLIGHIKALTLFHGGGYLRASVVSPSLPAQVETNASEGCAELDMTLNMLVYGLPRTSLERIVEDAANLPGKAWSGRAEVAFLYATSQDSHHHGC